MFANLWIAFFINYHKYLIYKFRKTSSFYKMNPAAWLIMKTNNRLKISRANNRDFENFTPIWSRFTKDTKKKRYTFLKIILFRLFIAVVISLTPFSIPNSSVLMLPTSGTTEQSKNIFAFLFLKSFSFFLTGCIFW